MSSICKESCDFDSEDIELRRGPWTLEEDSLLIHYISCHGEGRWDMLAKCSGLKRTGKSCRLRWLNYLKPDVRRGNLTLEEQVMILELHSKWGNRWSRIAQHLPGRTDNEIKNYWRTRVQKHARQLKIDANSAAFRDVIRCFWMPRLLQKIEEKSQSTTTPPPLPSPPPPPPPIQHEDYNSGSEYSSSPYAIGNTSNPYLQGADLDGFNLDPVSGLGGFEDSFAVRQVAEDAWVNDGMPDSLWNMDELWQFTKQEESSP